MTAKRWITGPAGVVTLSCAVLGCGGDEGITPAEADAVITLIGSVASGPLLTTTLGAAAPGDPLVSAPSRPLPARPGAFEYSLTVSCEEGGSVTLSGTVDFRIAGDSLGFELEGTATFADCSGTEDGVALTLVSGSITQRLGVVAEYSGDFTSAGLAVEGDWSGDVTVDTGDEDGSEDCHLDVTLDVSIVLDLENWSGSVEGSVTGTVCEEPVDVTVNESWFGF